MKLLLVTLSLWITLSKTFAQNVNIPDANFKAILLGNSLINTNGDSEIQLSEATSFNGEIECGAQNIQDLTGIEAFINLRVLICHSNSIPSLDLTSCINLEYINCLQNPINTLNINGLVHLHKLKFYSTNISSLDLSTNINLDTLYCNQSQLTTLDLSGLSKLLFVNCSQNQITTINLTGCDSIINLQVHYNLLENVNVSHLSKLKEFHASHNPFNSVDLSQNLQLEIISLYENNSLKSIDLSQNIASDIIGCGDNDSLMQINIANGNNINFSYLYLMNNPMLTCIQVDDSVWSNNPSNWDETQTDQWGDFFYSFDINRVFSEGCFNSINLNTQKAQLNSQNISIYPNPFYNNTINIQSANLDVERIILIDLSGKIVREFHGKNIKEKINLPNLKQGIYFIKIVTNKESYTKKIIKI